jgi:hypothetical protein
MALDDARAWKRFRALPSPGGAIPPWIRHPVRPKCSAQVDPGFPEPAGSELAHAENTVC